MITQRQIDIWHIEAQEFQQKIREEFMQNLNNNRPQPQPQAQPQVQPQPQAGDYGTPTA